MKGLFDMEGPVMQFITKLVYSVWLNILWFICCLPVFTVGASTTALFYVSLKVAKNEEGNLTKSFFHSFKENFRQATIIWLILFGVGIVLGIDAYVFYHMRFESVLWALGTAVFVVALAAYGIIWMYIFPLQARFDNTIRAMFKNSLMIGMRFLLCTVLMALIYFIMAVVVICVFTPAIIFGEGLCALLCSYLLSNILLLCEEKTEEGRGGISPAQETLKSGERKWSLKDVHGREKIGYIWEYYKLPIVAAGIFLYVAGYMIYGSATHKDTILYTALVNVSAGEAFAEELSIGFLDYTGADAGKEEVGLYKELYLVEEPEAMNHEYAYASNTKIVAAIAGNTMDVVLMDQRAFDIFSNRGYLCNMEQLLTQKAPDLYEELWSCLVSNKVILEDNSVDVQLDPSVSYMAVTDEYPMAVDVSHSALMEKEGLNGTLYLGIISNSPRVDMAITYLQYLTETYSQ